MSHYQVEGNDACDWSEWERAGRTRGEACGDAVDSWHRYEDDADLAKAAGANAFRFSISWSRIERDENALARYRRFIEHLIAIGVEPVVTLFHYTHPTPFHTKTPWTSTSSVRAFRRFTERVVDAIGDLVRFWIPLNEPLVFVLAGYYDGQIPPGVAKPNAIAKVLDHLLASHVEAAEVIRAKCGHAVIGIAHNMMAFAPERPRNVLDRTLTRVAHRCYNLGLVEAFATGRWDFILPPATRVKGRRDDLPKSLDVFGANFYSRLHLRWPREFQYLDRTSAGLTDNGWEIVPDALDPLLRDASQSGFPVIVTENGLADASDAKRAKYIEDHVAAIARVEASGVPIDGYFHWSLLDNYEWLDGFGPKFGLYEVDRITMHRTPRASAETFRRMGERFLASR